MAHFWDPLLSVTLTRKDICRPCLSMGLRWGELMRLRSLWTLSTSPWWRVPLTESKPEGKPPWGKEQEAFHNTKHCRFLQSRIESRAPSSSSVSSRLLIMRFGWRSINGQDLSAQPNVAHCVYPKMNVINSLTSWASNVLPSGICVGGRADHSELKLFAI